MTDRTDRQDCDTLRLEITSVLPPEERDFGFHVLVYINEFDMIAEAAGLGMNPFDILIPVNRLAATTQPRTVPIARCRCTIYDCTGTDVIIQRDGDLVHWTWFDHIRLRRSSADRSATFAADAYAEEIARAGADRTWETPANTAARLILTQIAEQGLLPDGVSTTSWLGVYRNAPDLFKINLEIGDDYQIFIDLPWDGRSPEQFASDACATLAGPTHLWPARWHPVQYTDEPPAIAGPTWRREPLTSQGT